MTQSGPRNERYWHETRKDRNGVRKLYARDERIIVTWKWISVKQGT